MDAFFLLKIKFNRWAPNNIHVIKEKESILMEVIITWPEKRKKREEKKGLYILNERTMAFMPYENNEYVVHLFRYLKFKKKGSGIFYKQKKTVQVNIQLRLKNILNLNKLLVKNSCFRR